MTGSIKYEFSATPWQHDAGWVFVSLPKGTSKEIREHLGWQEEGWGRMKASAQIEEHNWNTAIWFDSKAETYLLPLKAEVRKKLKLELDKELQITLWI